MGAVGWPRVEAIGKPDAVLAVLQNNKAVRTGGVPTAVDSWLPNTDDCENLKYAFMLNGYSNHSGSTLRSSLAFTPRLQDESAPLLA